MKLYIDCCGCEQRQLETQRIRLWCKQSNISITKEVDDCDYAVLVTCAVDKRAIERSLELILHISQNVTTNRIIVGGCLSSIDSQSINEIGVHSVFSPRNIEKLPRILKSSETMENIPLPSFCLNETFRFYNTESMNFREEYSNAKKGYKVVIADGCASACSYCAIRFATGKLKSIPQTKVIERISQGIVNPNSMVMLMAGDTGSYGQDIGSSLYELLRICCLKFICKLYIHDFNAMWLVRSYLKYKEVFNDYDKNHILRIMNIPIQSGSNKILKLMNRNYSAESITRCINEIKELRPDIGIGTHIIVGFPQETEDDFEQTITMLKETRFDFITCFPYSEHYIAPSSSLKSKVPFKVVKDRLIKLQEIFGERCKF